MILDSSAILAVIFREPGYEVLIRRITGAPLVAVGAPTLVETALVLTARLGRDVRLMLSEFVRQAEAEIVPFTEEHYQAAIDAFARFGKGRHPAALNLGDCLTYAVARVAAMPLLFTGDDFQKTDLPPAI